MAAQSKRPVIKLRKHTKISPGDYEIQVPFTRKHCKLIPVRYSGTTHSFIGNYCAPNHSRRKGDPKHPYLATYLANKNYNYDADEDKLLPPEVLGKELYEMVSALKSAIDIYRTHKWYTSIEIVRYLQLVCDQYEFKLLKR